MSGTFSSFMRGYETSRQQHRQDREDQWQQQEREYQTNRRAITDGRDDTTWNQKQEDRQRTLARDEQEYPLHFRSLEQGVEKGEIDLNASRFDANRKPELARQADEMHGLNVQNIRQAMGVRASQEARASAQHRVQMELDQLGLDEERLGAEHRKFTRAVSSGINQFMLTGDTKAISQAWKTALGTEGNGELVEVARGRYAIVDPDTGEQQEIGSRDDVANALALFVQRPEAFLELKYQQQFGGGRGGKGQPAAIQEAEYVASLLPEVPGESAQARRLRAYEITQFKGMGRPEEVRAKIATDLVKSASVMGGDIDPAALSTQVNTIMSAIYGDQQTQGYGLGAAMGQQAPSRDGGSPPVPGARQAPDGNWYVQQNGQWYRVD